MPIGYADDVGELLASITRTDGRCVPIIVRSPAAAWELGAELVRLLPGSTHDIEHQTVLTAAGRWIVIRTQAEALRDWRLIASLVLCQHRTH